MFLIFILVLISPFSFAQKKKEKAAGEYYTIKIWNFSSASQETIIDNYLEKAYLPALHKNGFKSIGVFKPFANDTSASKKIYVYIPVISPAKMIAFETSLEKDNDYNKAAEGYMNAAFDNVPFSRMETIVLKSFRLAPQMKLPKLTTDKKEHVYELRSYESPTQKLYWNKVQMFNEGGEVALFARLNFNAVFYADVISGSHMPNLMYMTSFETMEERKKHWDSFVNDPEWKRLSSLPEYQHNVSRSEIILMKAADYSDF